jgi:hypothetical protein
MPSVRITFAMALVAIAVAVAVVLSESPATVLATNAVSPTKTFGEPIAGLSICQANERLPRHTVGLRLSIGAFTGPGVSVRVISDSGVVTSGALAAGWDGQTATIPVRPLARAVAPVRICFASSVSGGERIEVKGAQTRPPQSARTGAGKAIGGRVAVAYLGSGHSSWATRISAVATHMGLGRAWSGTWIVPLVAALMLLAVTLVTRLVARELDE